MPNLYGVANAPGYPLLAGTPGGNPVTCNAGVATDFITGPNLVAPSQGYFWVHVFVNLSINWGATIANPVLIWPRFGSGSNWSNGMGLNPSGAVANGWSYWTFTLVSPISQVAFQGTGSPVNISMTPTGAALTISNFSTQAFFTLFRAPDQ
jgi:hypothetical protein